jgi:hypothetical protein
MSLREAILAAVATALAGTAQVSTRIYRSRVEALSSAEHPAIVIEPIADTSIREAVGRLTWELDFTVSIIVTALGPDTAADPIVLDAYNKVMSNASLQAKLVDLVPVSTNWQFFEANKPLCAVSMHFQATYQTSETNLTTL